MNQNTAQTTEQETPEELNRIGSELWQSGKKEEAESFFKRALEIAPFHPLVLNSMGVVHHERGEFDLAEKYYLKALTFAPQYAPLYDNLGRLNNAQKRFMEAVARFEAAVELDPGVPVYHYNLATAHYIFNQYDKAIETYKNCLDLDPEYLDAWIGLGESYININDNIEAEHCYKKALEIDPACGRAYHNLFICYDMNYQPEKRKEILEQARKYIKNDDIRLKYMEARMANIEKDYERGLSYLNDIEIPAEPLGVDILYEAGWMYDRLKDSEKAYNLLAEANRLQEQSEQASILDVNGAPYILRKEKESLTEESYKSWTPTPENKNYPDPIFLTGFPRSGTTLMGQILHSHPDFYVGEENSALERARSFIINAKAGYPQCLATLEPELIEEARKVYFDIHKQEEDWEDKKYIVDKSPTTSANAMMVHRLFPNAKFIFMQRHPCDVIFSCFMQKFRPNGQLIQFYNLERAARYYALVMDCWEHYKTILPLKYHITRYETLVEDFEEEIKKVIAFTGAEWDDTVLEYNKHALKTPRAMTPSYNQITQKIYKDARYRWERYREQMAPVLSLITPYAEKAGYDL